MSNKTVRVQNAGTGVVVLRDPDTGHVYRIGDHEGAAKGIVQHPTRVEIPADEWKRIASLKGTQRLLNDATTKRPATLQVR